MKNTNKYFYILLMVCLTFTAFSQQEQTVSTKSVKAKGYYETANKLYNSQLNDQAIEYLNKALKEDTSFVEAYLLKAEIYSYNQNVKEEIETYKKLLSVSPDQGPKIYLYLSRAEIDLGRYKDAKTHLQKAQMLTGLTQRERIKVNFSLKQVNFALRSIEHPVPYNPVNLGNNINTNYNEYWPSLTANEKTLIFTRELPSSETEVMGHTKGQEDIYISHKDKNNNWTLAESISPNINTPNNEGSQSISADERLLIFTSCGKSDTKHCDLFFTERDSSGWQKPVNMGSPINSPAWDAQPCLAADGLTMYFVSNRPGGKGGMDIWMSTLTESGTWGEPVNLGDSVNTPGNEMSPYMHPDNQTLYFSSDGHIGMGKQDIYMVKRKGANSWGTPVNLGYPINTFNDEYGMIVNALGNMAYFSSDRLSKKGKDIFAFALDKRFRPVVVTYTDGVIVDSETKKAIKADVELSDLETAEIVAKSSTVKGTGEYLMCLPTDKDYGLNISKKGYVFHSENFSLKDNKDSIKPFKINVALQSIKVGRKEILHNVFFAVDSYELSKKSTSELRNLIKFMNQNPEVSIEIGGHTDITGLNNHNDTLSENRAKVVFDYLINKGIPKERLTYKGYSSTMPIADNSSEQGKALNRRTEFKIIDIKQNNVPK